MKLTCVNPESPYTDVPEECNLHLRTPEI